MYVYTDRWHHYYCSWCCFSSLSSSFLHVILHWLHRHHLYIYWEVVKPFFLSHSFTENDIVWESKTFYWNKNTVWINDPIFRTNFIFSLETSTAQQKNKPLEMRIHIIYIFGPKFFEFVTLHDFGNGLFRLNYNVSDAYSNIGGKNGKNMFHKIWGFIMESFTKLVFW